MKVILAGLPKTGIKVVHAALTKLGYKVYGSLENFMYDYDDWVKIYNHGETTSHFKEMYKDVDAVLDVPACFFWKEIHEAFPEAKVILTVIDEQDWLKSLRTQFDQFLSVMNSVAGMFSIKFLPIVRHFIWFATFFEEQMGVTVIKNIFSTKFDIHYEQARQKFRLHNAMVQQEISRDKLLIYHVTEEWEPLCEFLNEEIPKEPFPHKNGVGGKDIVPIINKYRFEKRAIIQCVIVIVLMITILVLVLYLLKSYPPWVGIVTFLNGLSLLFYVL